MLRRFRFRRYADPSGVSGPGVPAKGIELWRGGVAIIRWHVQGKPSSIELWRRVQGAVEIHGHKGATRLEWHW